MEYLAQNWLAILSLIIALLGGIPGILAVIKNFKDKPQFHFSLTTVITSETIGGGENQKSSMILIAGTLSNNGPQPLSPSSFDLSVEINGQWVPFKRYLIPENIQFPSPKQQIDISEPWKKDLQRFSDPIPRGTPIHGFLMFKHEDIDIASIRKAFNKNQLLKVTCTDIYGVSHVKELHWNINRTPISKDIVQIHPKHGISIRRSSS